MAEPLATLSLSSLSFVEGALAASTPTKRVKIEPAPYLRASGMSSFCPREQVLLKHANLWGVPEQDPDSELNFNLGSGMHWAMQNLVLPRSDTFVGNWVCNECGAAYGCPPVRCTAEELLKEPDAAPHGRDLARSCVPRPTKCITPDCTEPSFTYREPMLFHKELRIGGHPDAFFRLPGRSGLGIGEIKSISTGGMKQARLNPLMEHVVQLHTYFLLTEFEWGVLIYWEKGRYGRAAIVEHIVKRDDGMISNIRALAASYWTALAAWDGKNREVLPARVCGSKTCPRASDCVLAAACFEDDAGSKALDGF